MGTRLAASSRMRLAITVALVFVGCFLGASADVLLQFPGLRAAIIFAPYAIVTAALLRTPTRRWWIVLLAASAADFFPHRGSGASVPFVLLAEVVNHLRAVLAAICLRRYSSRPGRLETMREMVAYLVFAVFLVPAFAALGGAALVARFGTAHDFWPAWQQWWLSNAVTGLTLLPLLMVDFRRFVSGFRVSARRAGEAGLLAGCLLLVGVSVLVGAQDRFGTHPVHFYWALPFLLWAAVRFGPRATTAALLAITVVSVWGAITQRGPFITQSPTRGLIELQVFLLAISVPVLLLSVLFNQQRRTAAALDEIRRQYQSVVEDQAEMICRFRPDGRFTFANRAYGEAFGRAPVDLIGRNVWELVPPGVHRSRAELAGMTTAFPVITRELNVAPEGASARWQQWRERALFDESGAVVEYQMVGQDITDRKLAEEEGRKLAAQKSVEAALREADRRKDEFLAMLGHELRNPLAPIGTSLEILRMAPPDGPEAAWARDAIGRQLRHMTRLLDDLLDISRITLGRIRLKLEPIDLGRVVANAVETARPLIDAFGHQSDGAVAGGRGADARRSCPAHPGGGQPAEQRGQVHRAGRANRGGGAARRRAGAAHRARQRDRRGRRRAGDDLRAVLADAQRARAGPGRSRHRPHAGEAAGGAARRERSRRGATVPSVEWRSSCSCRPPGTSCRSRSARRRPPG